MWTILIATYLMPGQAPIPLRAHFASETHCRAALPYVEGYKGQPLPAHWTLNETPKCEKLGQR